MLFKKSVSLLNDLYFFNSLDLNTFPPNNA